MALSDKLNAAYESMSQGQNVSSARAKMQPIREDIVRINAEIQEIADSGDFGTTDPDIEAALTQTFNAFKAFEATLENPTIAELLDWKP